MTSGQRRIARLAFGGTGGTAKEGAEKSPARRRAGSRSGGRCMLGRDGGRLRVAIIGYGYWGSKHVRVLGSMPGVEVTVVDLDPERRAEAARSFPAARTARSLDEALHEVDAAVVASPPASHHAIALEAISAGVHCLVEKPLAVTSAQAEQ